MSTTVTGTLTLQSLPTELFITIAAEIPTYFALASFAASCHSLHDLLFPLFMRKALNDTNLNLSYDSRSDSTILCWASRRGFIRVVKGLLEAGAVVDATTTGHTALMSAMESGHEDVVEQLIAYGADPNLTFKNQNALALAVRSNQPGALRTLFRHGVTVDRRGWWMILSAASDGYVDVVRILLENGVDPNYQETSWYEGQTALHLAIWNDQTSMIDLLRDHGADTNAVDNDGQTVFQYLIWNFYLLPSDKRCLDALCGRKWWRKIGWRLFRGYVFIVTRVALVYYVCIDPDADS